MTVRLIPEPERGVGLPVFGHCSGDRGMWRTISRRRSSGLAVSDDRGWGKERTRPRLSHRSPIGIIAPGLAGGMRRRLPRAATGFLQTRTDVEDQMKTEISLKLVIMMGLVAVLAGNLSAGPQGFGDPTVKGP